jgi:hypothetical protein
MANAERDLATRVKVLDDAHEAGELTDVGKDPRQAFLEVVSGYAEDAQAFAKLMQTKSSGGKHRPQS